MKRPQLATVCLICVGLFFVGCVTTPFALVAPDQTKVDPALLGDFESIDVDGKHTSILIRNLDDKQYFIEIQPSDADKPERYHGFVTTIAGAMFAEIKQITDDGTVPGDWTLLRVDLADKKLTLRQLNKEFFDKQAVRSVEDLRKFLESNLDNHELYDHNAVIVATKIG